MGAAWIVTVALLVGACGEGTPGKAQAQAESGTGPTSAELLAATVATCSDATGTIEVRRKGGSYWEPAAVGVMLRDGDWIRAGDGSSARLRLVAGGHLELGARSAILVEAGATATALASAAEGTAVAVPDEPAPEPEPEPDREPEPTTPAVASTGGDPAPDRPRPVRRPKKPAGPRLPYPQSVSPAADARVKCAPSVALTWRAVDGAVGYRVSIARDLTFKSIVKFVEVRGKTTYKFTPVAAGAYAWRVAARGRDGRYGEYGFARRVHCAK